MPGVSKDETEALTTSRRGSRIKKTIAALFVLTLALSAAAFLGAPPLASAIVKGKLVTTLNNDTTLDIDSVSISWLGPQRFENITLDNPAGDHATLDAALDRSLLALLMHRGRGDLGTLSLSGQATLHSSSIFPSAPDQPTDLPPVTPDTTPIERTLLELGSKFSLAVEIEHLDLTILHPDAQSIRASLSGSAALNSGQPAVLSAHLEIDPTLPGGPTGTADATISITDLLSPEGTLNSAALTADSSVVFTSLPAEILSLLPQLPSDFYPQHAIGSTLTGELRISGILDSTPPAHHAFTVSASITTPVSQLTVNSRLEHNRLTPVGDNAVTLSTHALTIGWPYFLNRLENKGLDFSNPPRVTLTLSDFDLALGQPLAAASFSATVSISDTSITLTPNTTEQGSPARLDLDPTTLHITLDNAIATLVGPVAFRLDNAPTTTALLDLSATGLTATDGSVALTRVPAVTGTVALDGASTSILDRLLGSPVPSQALGPVAQLEIKINSMPLDNGTLVGALTSPRATGEFHAQLVGGVMTLTSPATLTLAEITQPFSYSFTPMLPVIGALTKDPAVHRPATLTLDTLSVPIPFDLAQLDFSASIDPGTAALIADNNLAGLLKGRPSIGDSLEPFAVTMTRGVLHVTQLTIPIGEFSVFATGTYDLAANAETVFVQLPAAALLSEAFGGSTDLASGLPAQLLSRFLNVGLRKAGPLNADNPWQIDTDASTLRPEPTEDEIIDTVFDLIDLFGG